MDTHQNGQISFRQSLFWDTDPAKIDVEKHARYIIERVFDLGTKEEIRWLFAQYPKPLLREVLGGARSELHDKSRALWSLVLR